MNKIMNFLKERVTPIAGKLSSNNFLAALNETMVTILPIIIVGSFAALFAFIEIDAWQSFLQSNPTVAWMFMNTQSLTVNLIALYVVSVLTYKYAKKLDLDGISTSITGIATFLLVTPTETYVAIPEQWLGHTGMISAIIIGLVVPHIMGFFVKRKIGLKMPDSVPQFVQISFSSLIPVGLILIGSQVLATLMALTTHGSIHQFIYSILQVPFQNIGSSLPGVLIVMFAVTLFMFMGIHGNTVYMVVLPLYMANNAANLAASQAREALPHIVTSSWVYAMIVGGLGCVLPFVILLAFKAKSKRLKSVGRISIVPAIFNITEPVLFGTPILFNPMLLIPYLICPLFNVTVGYVLTAINIIPRVTGVEVIWSVPSVISGFLSQGWQLALLQFGLLIINLLIYYPFFKMYDNMICEEEQKESELVESIA